jgi:dipeptidyl aminopeptidase/acylaminoacyl peptidase
MRYVLLQILLLLPSAGLFGQAKHTPTPDEMLSLRTVSSVKLSPDGRFVAFRWRETNWKDDTFVSQLWLMNVATGTSFQLTRGKKSADQVEWSPDGRWLAFVTERESTAIEPEDQDKQDKKEKSEPEKKDDGDKTGDRQIWVISPEGGEAWQLTKSEADVDFFHWSKDGKSIAFVAESPDSKAAKTRKDRYAGYDVFEKDFEQHQLWLVDAAAAEQTGLPAKAKKLTSNASLDVASFDWSPDSQKIAFSAAKSPLPIAADDLNIYLLDLRQNNLVTKIVALPEPDDSPIFSPDGKRLAFTTALGQANYYYANTHIAVVDLATVTAHPATTAADVLDLTAGFDENADLSDWGPDGIYFAAQQKTSSHLFRINPESHAIQRLTSPDGLMVEDASYSKDFQTVAFIAPDATHMEELYVSPVGSFAPRKLTDATAQVKDWTLGTAEVVSWKSHDGARIEGILRKPADFDPAKKYPLLVHIHGGPTGTSLPTLSPAVYAYPVQIFLAKEALVLEPNYRGSAGYGAAFRALNVRNLGVGDMWDVMSGVDALVAKGIVDTSRMASMGWSEGGYISAFLTTHTDRFKAISVGAGISDWMTYYVSTDITPFTRQYLQSSPWDDPSVYAKTSPITTIKQAKTPTLIQQGDNDKRVPVPDSFELYRGLQDQGVPSRLILYKGFGHGINKPKSARAVLETNRDWFGYYIWNEPIPKNSPLYGSSEAEAGK